MTSISTDEFKALEQFASRHDIYRIYSGLSLHMHTPNIRFLLFLIAIKDFHRALGVLQTNKELNVVGLLLILEPDNEIYQYLARDKK